VTPAAGDAPDSARVERATALVRAWLAQSEQIRAEPAARRLAAVLGDPSGLDFTVGFVDGVIRPEDPRVAAQALAKLARQPPSFLSPPLRMALGAGGALAPVMPKLVVPAAQRVLRRLVAHLIIDATDARLGRSIARLRRPGVSLNVNLLGEAVLGADQAERRLGEVMRLLSRPDVDYVSVKVSAVIAPHSPWARDEAVNAIADNLEPLMRRARDKPGRGFVNLDMEEYRDLDLTIAVFMRLLERPEFHDLEAGIVLQAYLPDALDAMMRLQGWAAARVAAGGASIKVRLVKGANLPMEQVESSVRDWPLATWSAKQQTDTNYKRVLDWAMTPERVANVRLGIAGHNLFDIAYAWLMATDRSVTDRVEFEMLLGMTQAYAEVVRETVGHLLLYTPVVHPAEFDVAIAYLVRRLEEMASTDNFMSAALGMTTDAGLFERERERFQRSIGELDASVPRPNRTQDRNRPDPPTSHDRFDNTADTDPSLPANLAWARGLMQRASSSNLGVDAVEAARLTSSDELHALIGSTRDAAAGWWAIGANARAELLHRAGDALAEARGALIEVMAAETGKTVEQADPEVSEAVDFAHYYAEQARELERIDGATFQPASLTVVAPPWNFPVSIPTGSTLAALAAGSAVALKPAPESQRCAAMLAEALWSAGIPRDVLRLVVIDESELGQALIGHPAVDRVILTGSYETAALFRSFRRDLKLLAETSGKNAIVVTPSADFDLAVRDVVASAFGHAGQKCSAASLVILVGSVARSERFRRQLVDAVRSLEVGPASRLLTQMGPLITPAAGKLLEALTTLEPGQSWLLEPRQLDKQGRLWTPGLKDGVTGDSSFHRIEYFGPLLGIMTAETLEHAIELQNGVDYGLTAGLHSLDRDEIATWLDLVQAGNLYVNRGITGAVVRRQPFGGWKRSAVGPGAKAGGPNYLLGMGHWAPTPSSTLERGTSPRVQALLDAASKVLNEADLASLHRAAASDQGAWDDEYALARDVSGLTAERNVFRYRSIAVAIRLGADASTGALIRVCAAAARSGSPHEVSSAHTLPDALLVTLEQAGINVRTEDSEHWAARIAASDFARVRAIGGDAEALTAATDGAPSIAVYDGIVTESGRIELLPFLHEQAISITAHRFGAISALTDGLP
jgi:RHH-type transcriptional regulator, proline utilization regulon repressor / proline dehydrogenase / delta 1-pyrroline-5-carboxylate dehydrogenase